MKNIHLFRFAFLIAAAVFGAAIVRAEDLGAVKARMSQRLGAVVSLKDKGIAGENNRGFLEVKGAASAADQSVVTQENADRNTVYTALAAETKTSADLVGRKRAQQIAEIARPGHLIQDASGAWKKK